jgi:hypothetical protein
MTLGELLSELRGNILSDLSNQVAGASDYLWSDDALVRYINEAHRRFAQRTQCLRDNATPEVTQFVTVANQNLYQLHRSVISVLSVRMVGDKADLARAGHADFDTYHEPDTYFFDPAMLSQLPPGKPLAFSTDEGIGQDDYGSYSSVILRLYPVVSSDYAGITGNLRVTRYPLLHFSSKNLKAIPEIPEDYHLNMLDWAAYLALRRTDLDVAGGDAAKRAADFAKSFEQHVQDALQIFKRKTFTPMQWAFGRNGFTWWDTP